MKKLKQLPEEIWEEILLRLQVVDLLRSKSVCKSWYRIISGAQFIRRHLQNSKSKPSHHRILTPYSNSSMKTIDCSDLFTGELVTNNLPPPCEAEVTFLGTCDGLVCFYNHISKRICMWNPATRISKSLGITVETGNEGRLFYWFGHESDDDDVEYKLVIGAFISDEMLIHFINPFADEVDGDEWELFLLLPRLYMINGAGTLLNRRLHWAAIRFMDEDIANVGSFVIVSFDLGSKSIVEIPGHEGTVILELATMCAINGCLSAVHNNKVDDKLVFELWTMKEYGVQKSWTKLATILSDTDVQPFTAGCFPRMSVVAVTDKGELIIKVEETELFVCNIAEGKSRNLMSNTKGMGVMYVVESLVFPSGVPIVGSLAK